MLIDVLFSQALSCRIIFRLLEPRISSMYLNIVNLLFFKKTKKINLLVAERSKRTKLEEIPLGNNERVCV